MLRNILSLLGVVIAISLVVVLNSELIKYREKELSFNLDIISKSQSDRKSVGLISRYLLIKKRIEQGGESENDYIIESKLQGILNSMTESKMKDIDAAEQQDKDLVENATKLYLRIIRLLLGKSMPEDLYRAYNDPFIELAYFYERYRMYDKALAVMDNIRKRRKNPASYTRRTILLHSGFCYAMMSEYAPARDAYTNVIRYFPSSDEARTARVLLSFLTTINNSSNTIMAQEISKQDKAEKLYLISAYKQSQELYSDYLKKSKKDTKSYVKARFYRGRSSEELGDKKQAVEDYKYIIAAKPKSDFAKKANRRLLILGNFYKGDKKLLKIAKDDSKKLGDENFINKVTVLKKKMVEDNFKESKVKKDFKNFVEKTKEIKIAAKKEEKAEKKKTDKEQDITTAKIDEKTTEIKSVDSANIITPTISVNSLENFKKIVKKDIVEKKIEKTEEKLPPKLLKAPLASRWIPPDEGNEPLFEDKLMVKIESKDGFYFEGEILEEGENEILIKSEFGNIPIPRNMIGNIQNYKKRVLNSDIIRNKNNAKKGGVEE